MAERAAIVTGGSGGIGLAIARALGEEGYVLTLSARRPEKLEESVKSLRADGFELQTVPANVADEESLVAVFAAHKEKYGRLDALVNNAGIGIGGPMEQVQAKHLDMQLAINLRSLIIATREGLPLLREAGAEHEKALLLNTASIAGKGGQAFLSVYAATKAAVINFTQSTARETNGAGIQCTALAPGFVDTAMSDFIKSEVPAEKMIQPSDIGEAVRFLLHLSPNCHVPEIVFNRPGEGPDAP
ncbi:MAG TPA: SDR family oxidoreductase [Solirubrobacterales bacterium]|jgi:NAD(P)-dependent dehydrogenase (short-subunit alcohol dehydrogenase family)|nr:SDR family oxidoreductase [Solirubrobacterales bacterium]